MTDDNLKIEVGDLVVVDDGPQLCFPFSHWMGIVREVETEWRKLGLIDNGFHLGIAIEMPARPWSLRPFGLMERLDCCRLHKRRDQLVRELIG